MSEVCRGRNITEFFFFQKIPRDNGHGLSIRRNSLSHSSFLVRKKDHFQLFIQKREGDPARSKRSYNFLEEFPSIFVRPSLGSHDVLSSLPRFSAIVRQYPFRVGDFDERFPLLLLP